MRNALTRVRSFTAAFGLVLSVHHFAVSAAIAEPRDLFAVARPDKSQTVDHSAWDALLSKYVRPHQHGASRFDYKGVVAADRLALRNYIASLERVDPATLGRSEQLALLVNLYNAKTIEVVLDHYPVKSIKDISLGGGIVATLTGGPWKQKVTKLRDEPLSLDDIEHGILRPVFKDPRVHYALNCASIGCPNLRTEAFAAAKLDAQLDDAARAFINDPRGVDASEKGLRASSIYSWFKEDFGDSDAAVIAHFKKFADANLTKRLETATRIDDYDYDWTLNDVDR